MALRWQVETKQVQKGPAKEQSKCAELPREATEGGSGILLFAGRAKTMTAPPTCLRITNPISTLTWQTWHLSHHPGMAARAAVKTCSS